MASAGPRGASPPAVGAALPPSPGAMPMVWSSPVQPHGRVSGPEAPLICAGGGPERGVGGGPMGRAAAGPTRRSAHAACHASLGARLRTRTCAGQVASVVCGCGGIIMSPGHRTPDRGRPLHARSHPPTAPCTPSRPHWHRPPGLLIPASTSRSASCSRWRTPFWVCPCIDRTPDAVLCCATLFLSPWLQWWSWWAPMASGVVVS